MEYEGVHSLWKCDGKYIEVAFILARFQSLFLAANRGGSRFPFRTLNLDPLYDVLVEPLGLGYDALLLEYHGIEYPDLPEAPDKAISAFRTVKGHSYVPHRSGLNPHPF